MSTAARRDGWSSSDRTQVALLVVLTGFVGAMVGLERSLLPLVAASDFGFTSTIVAGSFLATFAPAKAVANLAAGRWSDRFGRRPVLVAGWLLGLPVPLVVGFAPAWEWIVVANALLGVNQGLCWSMTLNLKLDRVPAGRRGWVLGWNEAGGYLGVAIAAFLAALIAERAGLRPAPFLLGLAIATIGLLVSLVLVRDAPRAARADQGGETSLGGAFRAGSWADRSLATLSLAGVTTNMTDGVAWALLPIALVASGADLAWVGVVTAVYPVTWGLGQLVTGRWSDRFGRRPLIVGGLAAQGVAIILLSPLLPVAVALPAAVLLGAGTALAYPTLIAAVGDRVAPGQRATAIGVYRFWRDLGTLVGALGAGLIADRAGLGTTFVVAGAVTLVVAAITLRELAGDVPAEQPAAGAGIMGR